MLESSWLFIGVVATLATSGAVLTSRETIAMVLGAMGFISWGIWTYGTFEITVVDGGVTYAFTEPAVAVFGILMAMLPLYIVLTGPIELAKNARGMQPDEL